MNVATRQAETAHRRVDSALDKQSEDETSNEEQSEEEEENFASSNEDLNKPDQNGGIQKREPRKRANHAKMIPGDTDTQTEKKLDAEDQCRYFGRGLFFGFLTVFIVTMSILIREQGSTLFAESKSPSSIEIVQKKFPTQDEFLWDAFKGGVEEVVSLNRPATFILLYEQEAQQTLDKIVGQVSKWATCTITSCDQKPVVLNDVLLNAPDVLKDPGIILEKYSTKLEESGVMIINNLENLHGSPAKVFHSFCDEIVPAVGRAFFIFTMKVQQMPSDRDEFVEGYFRKKWKKDMKSDTFEALITRLSGMILEIRP